MSGERDALWTVIQRADQNAWTLAAIGFAARPDLDERQRGAAVEVLSSLGLSTDPQVLGQVSGQAQAPILQLAALLADPAAPWDAQTDAALLAQGRASAQMASALKQFILPQLPGLATRLTAPNARMLDVGTGTGALALGFAEAFPDLEVVGLDVMPRVLRLAEDTLASSPAGQRVSLRQQDVAELDDEAAYDVVWLPAPFLPEPALLVGVERTLRATRPGGWVLLGHGKFGGDPVDDALTRFKTLAYGGAALDDAAASDLLGGAGWVDIVHLPTPPGAPALTLGRRQD
jgi:predicted O-methyltransferase YrrM